MRRAAKVDGNQSEIVTALRRIGVSVEYIKKPVDLRICHLGKTALMEIKNPGGKDQLSKEQIEFIARWPGQIHVVRSAEEAIKAVLGEEAMA